MPYICCCCKGVRVSFESSLVGCNLGDSFAAQNGTLSCSGLSGLSLALELTCRIGTVE